MSFVSPIRQRPVAGQEVVWAELPLTVLGAHGPTEQWFLFDTGCQITTVSEDVATVLGLPAGGRTVGALGSTAGGTGRLVDVRFRFPPTVGGSSGLEVASTWAVLGGRRNLALLGFMEVHRHFCIRSQEFDMFFISWAALRGKP